MALLRHLSGFIKGLPGGALELRLKCLLCEIQLLHRQLKRHRLHTHTHTHTQVLNLLALLVQSANTDSATCFTGVPTTHLLYWHQKSPAPSLLYYSVYLLYSSNHLLLELEVAVLRRLLCGGSSFTCFTAQFTCFTRAITCSLSLRSLSCAASFARMSSSFASPAACVLYIPVSQFACFTALLVQKYKH
jgi:hypothetical protein